MQIYLLAANLFALAAWLLGLGSFSETARSWRLVPLFLLVISRSLSLILSLLALEHSHAALSLGALEVVSTFGVVWALSGSTANWRRPWWVMAWLGTIGALFLALLPFWPAWPIPSQIHVMLVAIGGTLFIMATIPGSFGYQNSPDRRKIPWLYFLSPLMIALAGFLDLLGTVALAWLASLLGYGLFLGAFYQESMQLRSRSYTDRQRTAEALTLQALGQSREQQRWLEVSELLSAAPNPSQSMEHIARSMAQITHTDQAAIFMLEARQVGQVYLPAVYSPERPVHLGQWSDLTFSLESCPPLQQAIDSRQQLLFTYSNGSYLNSLYACWREERIGPTLIQPLVVKGRPVGALVLGNPVTNRPIRESDVRLCRNLAAQIAAIVEHRRRYLELEAEATAIATTATEKPSASSDDRLAVLEVISDGLVVSDVTGRVQWLNQAAERILGYPRSKLLHQPIGTIYGAIDSTEVIEDLVVAFSRRNQPLPTFKESDDRAVQGRLVPWRGGQGEWKGIVAVFRDVTREVKADRARNDFIAALSHELRAPLTAIKGYSDLIVHSSWGDYSPEQLRVQQIIQSSADRMVAVLNDAIQISAQNRHKLLPRFEEVDVAKLIEAVTEELASLIRLRELKFTCEIKGPLPPLEADQKHLRQILNNLLSNACRFSPPGGQVNLRAWVQVERTGYFDQPHLLLIVADNGVGIPRSEQKRIFDPFYQLKNQNVDTDIGMGMGLAVVKDLVELHNGRVWVESEVGQGSVFQVALPLSQGY